MKIVILGSGQDGGIPQAGCRCDICCRARKDQSLQRLGPSIAIVRDDGKSSYIVDTSPDFKKQLDTLMDILKGEGGLGRGEEKGMEGTGGKNGLPLNGIFLTHAHPGHYLGLWHLGKEAMNTKGVPLYCTEKMGDFLLKNEPFGSLVQRGNINIRVLKYNEIFKLDEIGFTPIRVPHRNESSDCVGYIIHSNKRVVYIPDIDHWTEEVLNEIRDSDIAILDGTFYAREEISRFNEVPHPPISETMEILKNMITKIYFTHLNHTNPASLDGDERGHIMRMGFALAHDGLEIDF